MHISRVACCRGVAVRCLAVALSPNIVRLVCSHWGPSHSPVSSLYEPSRVGKVDSRVQGTNLLYLYRFSFNSASTRSQCQTHIEIPQRQTTRMISTISTVSLSPRLDDLLMPDVLASFNKPSTSTSSTKRKAPEGSTAPLPRSTSTSQPSVAAPTAQPGDDDDDDDFEASLVEGMESLLRQLAGDHPPGPMPDVAPPGPAGNLSQSDKSKSGQVNMAEDEEEEAWNKAVQDLLSRDGLEALGLPKTGPVSSSKSAYRTSTSNSSAGPSQTKPTFDETIKRTLDSLNSAKSTSTPGQGADLASLLKALQSDPSALDGLDLKGLEGLDGLGDFGENDDLGGLLDGMMSQLMTREILEEPMGELSAKYPAYLANPPSEVSGEDLEKYRKQKVIVDKILAVFKKEGYSDERDGKEVAGLVGEMQDLGGPPSQIMGDMPEGFVSAWIDGLLGLCG